MSEKKHCVLEGAAPVANRDAAAADHANHMPCALLSPDAVPPTPDAETPPEHREVEDESADPVGDGHSDAEWAASHPEGSRRA